MSFKREDFNSKTIFRFILVLGLLLMIPSSLSPSLAPPSAWAPLLHVAALAGLSILACLAVTNRSSQIAAVSFVFAYSAITEFLQNFSPGRQATLEDLAVNGLGCFLGMITFLIGSRLYGTEKNTANLLEEEKHIVP